MKPYTYLIKHRPTGKVYYGYRSANKVEPVEDLWKKYFTSSPKIQQLIEETGIDTTLLTPVHTYSDDHGNWKYETVIAWAEEGLVAHEVNDESHEVRWVKIEKVAALPLHPSFAKSWPELQSILKTL